MASISQLQEKKNFIETQLKTFRDENTTFECNKLKSKFYLCRTNADRADLEVTIVITPYSLTAFYAYTKKENYAFQKYITSVLGDDGTLYFDIVSKDSPVKMPTARGLYQKVITEMSFIEFQMEWLNFLKALQDRILRTPNVDFEELERRKEYHSKVI